MEALADAYSILAAAPGDWPDGLDSVLVVIFLVAVVAVPLFGYWLMVIDIRAYLRALKGVLVVVKNNLPQMTPYWAHLHTPSCIRSLGLELPCNEQDVKQAYRQLAETLHPDLGGDRQRFMILQEQFEEAIRFLKATETNS